MTYRQTLDWMFAQLPMYQNKGASAFNAKLQNIEAFSRHLGNPHREFKSIHVAGTNGKGSSSHMLASVLQEAGYTTGLYTSPHLKDFRERIQIDGQKIPKRVGIDFIRSHKPYLEEAGLSFFEMTVGMAFDYFSRQQVDIAVIEVGLGGRLDSTNIIRPEVCLITNIGMDHADILGTELWQIAGEKAGIIKKGVPVVISETQEEIQQVFMQKAALEKAPIFFADQMELPGYPTDLLGGYQEKNIKGVLACLQALRGFDISESHKKKGLLKVAENTGLLGRWQLLGEAPRVICDTAHNREGLQLVLEQLRKENFKNLHIVLGFVKEKPVGEILQLFPKKARYYVAKPKIERGLEAEVLARKSKEAGLSAQAHNSIAAALKAALEVAEPEDLIFVGGSNFTVAEVL